MRYIELLAPARTADIGIEAILHGADAVYIGGPAFGARQAALNSVADIKRLCDFAKPFGVSVYVTLNTLLQTDEYEYAEKLAYQLYDIGVAALIIQDLSLLNLNLPPIPLHASTQLDNRTAEKVEYLATLGFEQVVLARELGIDDIQHIHESVPDVSLEVFVHGALCTSLSGRCHASEFLFNRSADRGECTQFCRFSFDLEDEHGNKLVTNRHLLSLCDMNRSKSIEQLIHAGATSFKIEGRLKDKSYVKNITAYYRKIIDDCIAQHPEKYARKSIGNEHITFKPDPSRTFNRGYTDYLSTDNIFAPFTPKSIGQKIGKVLSVGKNYITLAKTTITAGDGLCYFDANNQLQGFRANRVEGNRVYPRPFPNNLAVGTTIYRNLDFSFEKLLSENTSQRTIPIDIAIYDDAPDGFRLTATVVQHPHINAELHLELPHQPAQKPQSDNIRLQLSKLGNTPYICNSISVVFTRDWFIPSSLLSDWRRKLICELTSNTNNSFRHTASHAKGIDLPMLNDGDILMFCRHCLRRELDICPHGKRPRFKLLDTTVELCRHPASPLFIVWSNNKRLPLKFDCQHCQMLVCEPS